MIKFNMMVDIIIMTLTMSIIITLMTITTIPVVTVISTITTAAMPTIIAMARKIVDTERTTIIIDATNSIAMTIIAVTIDAEAEEEEEVEPVIVITTTTTTIAKETVIKVITIKRNETNINSNNANTNQSTMCSMIKSIRQHIYNSGTMIKCNTRSIRILTITTCHQRMWHQMSKLIHPCLRRTEPVHGGMCVLVTIRKRKEADKSRII
mmetsp:Transcript_72526/g.115719  ORF Transcript_72526/g.115719 Transcript_72526/m.115719 type:complete len:209 (-) Transcript_72526:500-1126(-)